MPCLNLLSPQTKKTLRLRYLLLLLENILGLLVVLAIGLIIILLPTRENLRQLKADTDELKQQTQNQFSVYQNQADSLKQQIKTYNDLQNKGLLPSLILFNFKRNQSLNIQINSLRWQENGFFELSGLAKTRAALVEFQNALKSQGETFQNIDIPLAQFLQKEMIPFTITGKISL